MNIHFHGPVDGVPVEIISLTSCAFKDDMVDGRAATATCGWSIMRCTRGEVYGWAMREHAWSRRRYWRQERLVDNNGRKMIAQCVTLPELTNVSSLSIKPTGNYGHLFHERVHMS
jgi:hypothetical protein